jgi:hypothetical protein
MRRDDKVASVKVMLLLSDGLWCRYICRYGPDRTACWRGIRGDFFNDMITGPSCHLPRLSPSPASNELTPQMFFFR